MARAIRTPKDTSVESGLGVVGRALNERRESWVLLQTCYVAIDKSPPISEPISQPAHETIQNKVSRDLLAFKFTVLMVSM